MFSDGIEPGHVALAVGLFLLFVAWPKIAARLPGAYGKAVGDEVEIVPTVGMRMEAWLMPPVALALVALFMAAVPTLLSEGLMVAMVVLPLWLGAAVMEIVRMRELRAVKRMRWRYTYDRFSLIDPASGERLHYAACDIERLEPRWFGPDRLHVADRAFDFVARAGGAEQFLDRAAIDIFNPRTDRAPGSCRRAPDWWKPARPAFRSVPGCAAHI